MDYTKVPRELIWKDKADLDNFKVDIPGSLDALMYNKIANSWICKIDGANEYVLSIFNNAYYITTLIQMEKRPELYLRRYLNIAESAGGGNNSYGGYFGEMTMALVYNYLRASNNTYLWGENPPPPETPNPLLRGINDYYEERSRDDTSWNSDTSCLYFENLLSFSGIQNYKMDTNPFRPRNILYLLKKEDAYTLLNGLDYVEERIMRIGIVSKCIGCYNLLIESLRRSNIQRLENTLRHLEERRDWLASGQASGSQVLEQDSCSSDDWDDCWEDVIDEDQLIPSTQPMPVQEPQFGPSNEEMERVSSAKDDSQQMQLIINEQKNKIDKLTTENNQLKKELSEANQTVEIPRLKIRIELLNMFFRELGYDTAWFTKNRKRLPLARVYAAILGHNKPSNIKEDVGKVIYVERPKELNEEVAEINKILADINNKWEIKL